MIEDRVVVVLELEGIDSVDVVQTLDVQWTVDRVKSSGTMA